MGSTVKTRIDCNPVCGDFPLIERAKPEFGILILGFNRPEILAKTLELLKNNACLSETKTFLSLDGPRGHNETRKVDDCRKVFDSFADECGQATKLYSDAHQGLRANVIKSVSLALRTVDKLLVLEDDCLIGSSSLDFFSWGFGQMDSRNDIGVISGTYLGPKKSNQAFFAKRFSSWGWATNRQTWHRFLQSKYSQTPLVELKSELSTLTSNDPCTYRYEYSQILRSLQGLDSWAIPFDLFLRSENMFALKSAVNQITNIGFGNEATNTLRGASLSIDTGFLDISKLQLASLEESVKIERVEAWTKFQKLAKDFLFRR